MKKNQFFSKDKHNGESCSVYIIHKEAVAAARAAMPDEKVLLDLADLFKMFADSTRIKIISALTNTSLCVCDIAALLSMTESAISHQLRQLRQTKLVRTRREGKVIYYSLDDEHVENIINQGLYHITE
jgi:DNA-binding transcriptional ArsR family regulator